ncbi:Lrp/AsnC family transcriptional regulator [Cytophagaceae bacterium DM2B3-1]|uniref:Lrp/AsnC family transcriptional regulator n=1 Tax=Xanthocytophaga flava TaxID=3048013 RepID=A0ABT7CWA7_9BACT|nr:Lrp/AsnC family transcriptional regulator [Xanthocytophaga flavus]MDJ1497225.1 Lrp/AsnC family transcriptional regulator [Xanthocytophaga flavus]
MQDMDEFDKKILNQLQQNNRVTAEELGHIVNLSTSAVQRRLKRLREDKIIEADISIISPSVVGSSITCVVDVTLYLGNSSVIDSFKELMSECKLVRHCYYVTGAYDFVIIVNTKDMKEYELFSKTYLMDNPNVKQFYTHVVMDKVKAEFGVII